MRTVEDFREAKQRARNNIAKLKAKMEERPWHPDAGLWPQRVAKLEEGMATYDAAEKVLLKGGSADDLRKITGQGVTINVPTGKLTAKGN